MISIVTITYQCEKYIDRCYFSILSQTFSDWEWVVVDDGSFDGTRKKFANFNDERVKYYYFNKNQGRGKARNFALNVVSGDWSVILDMDDMMYPNRLQYVVDAISEGYDYLISTTKLIDDSYKIIGVRDYFYNRRLKIFTHATLCIKTSLLKGIGYSNSRYAEDQRVILLVASNFNGKHIDLPLYIYHETASLNLSGAIHSNLAAFKSLVYIMFKEQSRKIDFALLIYTLSFLLKYFVLNIFRFAPSLYKFSYFFRSGKYNISRSFQLDRDFFIMEVKKRFFV